MAREYRGSRTPGPQLRGERYTRRVKLELAVVSVVGAFVWIFALIGVFSVASTVASGGAESARSDRLLLSPVSEAAGADIATLPRFPDASRREYQSEVYGDLVITKIEYVTGSDEETVRSFYREAAVRGGWTIADVTLDRGEWVYSLRSGDRRGIIEIEPQADLIEIDIELSEPSSRRGLVTDR